MIDTATAERWMRDANPIRDLDDVDPDELAYAVAVVQVRREADMQAPTHAPTPVIPTPPPRPWRKAWAFAAGFILILAVIGVAALVLRTEDGPVADEPAPPAEPTDEESADPTAPVTFAPDMFSDGWQEVAAGEPGLADAYIEALPGGGFFAMAIDPWALRWSPDGVGWFDADPDQVTGYESMAEYERYQDKWPVEATVVGEHVLIPNLKPPIGLWVGEPREGSWEFVPLDSDGLNGFPLFVGVGASDSEAMVVISSAQNEHAVWLIDYDDGFGEPRRLPDPAWHTTVQQPDRIRPVAWFNQRWLVGLQAEPKSAVYVSTDGSTWTETEIRWTPDATPLPVWPEDFVPVWSEDFVPGDLWRLEDGLDWATSPDAIVGSFFVGPHAYSEDGFTWLALNTNPEGAEDAGEWPGLTYSDELGFVAYSTGGAFTQMDNGQTWRSAGWWQQTLDGGGPTASGNRMLVGQEQTLWLWTPTNS